MLPNQENNKNPNFLPSKYASSKFLKSIKSLQILKKNQSYTNAKTPLRKRSLQTNPKKTLKFKSFNDLKLAKIRSLSKKLPNQFLYKSQTH